MKKKDPDRFYEIMEKTYDQTHKSGISDQKLKEWSEKFPDMIDRKIASEKRKLKKKLKDIKKSRKAKERFKTSQLRNQNIMRQLESIGYFAINRDSKMAKMKSGLENDEIIADIIEEISDPYGSDHDMVEINYDDQFKRKVKEYEERYKYVYVVEDVEPKEVKKKIIPKKKSIPKAKPVPKKEVREAIKTPVKKVKDKLFSSVVLSKNPIKITPVGKLEHVKEKPTIKKKTVKKAPIKKKTVKKKKPVAKKKPVKKVPIKKKTVKKKKPVKKKPVIKKRPPIKKVPKKKRKKPLPKVKSMRAKRRNSPITGRWTARYRSINGKKRKVLIRRWKGKIQTRII